MNSSEHNGRAPGTRVFYASGLATTLVGIAAISVAVESPGFFLLATALVCAGHFVSARLRSQGRSLRIVETVVIVICLATYARLFATGDTSPMLNPGLALFHKELSLAVMLVWAEVVRSFSLVSDEAVLFSSVPSLALIGVVATTGSGSDVIAYFTLWLVASILMFVESGRTDDSARTAGIVRTLTFSGTLGVGAVLVGALLSPLLQTSATWGFLRFAPTLSATRGASDFSLGDSEGNVLEISEGPVRLSSREEMRVRSSAAAYWRTRVWDVYSGRDWKSRATILPRESTSTSPSEFRADLEPVKGTTSTITQSFHSPQGFRGYIHAAAEPHRIWVDSDEMLQDSFNGWRLPRMGAGAITRYRVESVVRNASQDELRAAGTDYPDGLEPFMNKTDAPFQVRQEAERVTRSADNAYDKVMALRRYLARNCAYDLQTPPLPKKEDDAVRYFLFESRRGYCDVFASSLAVMARSLGIPARIATGFLPGEYDLERGEYVVRDRDRHSWAEIYFPGYGWQSFEATPSSDSTPQGFWASLRTELRYFLVSRRAWLALLLITVVFGVLAIRVLFPEDNNPDWRFPRRVPDPLTRQAQKSWKRLAGLAVRNGAVAGASTTPMELADAAAEAFGDRSPGAAEAVRAAAEILNDVLYSGREPDPGQIEDLQVAFRWAKRELAASRRQRPAATRSAA